jgi:tetratricopeptide (TPR) repeat protein
MRHNWFVLPLCLACTGLVLAQPTAREEPVEAAIRAILSAPTGAEAAAARDQARALLQQAPLTSPNFAAWVREISELYQTAGWNAKARSVLQDALARTASLADGGNLYRTILNSLAMAWLQDGNLLKQAGALEQLAAAQLAAPRSPAVPAGGDALASLLDRLGQHEEATALRSHLPATASPPSPFFKSGK